MQQPSDGARYDPNEAEFEDELPGIDPDCVGRVDFLVNHFVEDIASVQHESPAGAAAVQPLGKTPTMAEAAADQRPNDGLAVTAD
jgi:hypothetical protein